MAGSKQHDALPSDDEPTWDAATEAISERRGQSGRLLDGMRETFDEASANGIRGRRLSNIVQGTFATVIIIAFVWLIGDLRTRDTNRDAQVGALIDRLDKRSDETLRMFREDRDRNENWSRQHADSAIERLALEIRESGALNRAELKRIGADLKAVSDELVRTLKKVSPAKPKTSEPATGSESTAPMPREIAG